jgi:carnitine O-acetyltransferase
MDGTQVLRMNEFVIGSLLLHKADLGPPLSDSTPIDLPHPEELVFTTNEHIRTLVRSAEAKFDTLAGDHELHVRISLLLHIHGLTFLPGPLL